MRNILAIAFVLVSCGFASAESPTWNDVQRACGTEWREGKSSRSDGATWANFLNECKVRKGFVAKKAGKADFRLPDVAEKAN